MKPVLIILLAPVLLLLGFFMALAATVFAVAFGLSAWAAGSDK